MANGGTINFGIKYTLDQNSVNNIKKNLQTISQMTTAAFAKTNNIGNILEANKQLLDVKDTAAAVENALERAFNPQLDTYNISQFSKEINDLGLDKVYTDFQKTGTAGQSAFRNIYGEITQTQKAVKQTHTLLDKLSDSMMKTLTWGITSSIWNSFSNAVQDAYGYVKQLDSSLNDIRIVTGESADKMNEFAVQANAAAKNLGSSTLDYTQAALIYYQQGLSDEEVQARAEVTLKAANVTGQTGEEVSEQLTAVWNGYKVNAEEAELYVDKLAKVAAATAADLEELSTGMSKVASAANAMGVDVDQLNAQLATIVSVTRQAPESVGTALKTIYARMSDLKAGGTDEDDIGFGEVSGKMADMGIVILDENNNLREMGEIIEEVAAKWDTWTEAQQVAMAQVMAGKRQYNNLVALFENWDMYEDALATSQNAEGTLNEQNDIYLESMTAHLEEMSTAAERLYQQLFDSDAFKGFVDFGTGILDILGDIIDSIGGGGVALQALGGIATKVLSKNIAESLQKTLVNLRANKQVIDDIKAQKDALEWANNLTGRSNNDTTLQKVADKRVLMTSTYKSSVTPELEQEGNEVMKTYTEALDKQATFEADKKAAESFLLSLKSVTEQIEKIDNMSIEDFDLGMENFTSVVEDAKDQLEKASQQVDIFKKKVKEVKGPDNTSLSAVIKLNKAYKNLQETIVFTPEQQKSISDALNKTKTAFKELYAAKKAGVSDEEIENLQKKSQEAATEYINTIKDLVGTLPHIDLLSPEALELLDNAGIKVKNLGEQLNNAATNAESKVDEFLKKLKETDAIKNIATMVGDVTQLASGFSALSGAVTALGDDSKSLLEKFEGFATAIPLIVTSATDLKEVWDKSKGTLAELGSSLGDVIKKAKEQAGATLETTKATLGAAAAEVGAATGASAWTVAVNLLKTGLKGLLAALGPIGIAVAAISIGVTVFTAISDAIKKHQEQEAAVAEEAKNWSEAVKGVEESYEHLLDTVKNYHQAQEGIETLKKGTEEWQKQIEMADEAAEELINTYSALAATATIGENGEIIINEDELSKQVEAANTSVREGALNAALNNVGIGAGSAAEDTALFDNFAIQLADIMTVRGDDDIVLRTFDSTDSDVSELASVLSLNAETLLETPEFLRETIANLLQKEDATIKDSDISAITEQVLSYFKENNEDSAWKVLTDLKANNSNIVSQQALSLINNEVATRRISSFDSQNVQREIVEGALGIVQKMDNDTLIKYGVDTNVSLSDNDVYLDLAKIAETQGFSLNQGTGIFTNLQTNEMIEGDAAAAKLKNIQDTLLKRRLYEKALDSLAVEMEQMNLTGVDSVDTIITTYFTQDKIDTKALSKLKGSELDVLISYIQESSNEDLKALQLAVEGSKSNLEAYAQQYKNDFSGYFSESFVSETALSQSEYEDARNSLQQLKDEGGKQFKDWWSTLTYIPEEDKAEILNFLTALNAEGKDAIDWTDQGTIDDFVAKVQNLGYNIDTTSEEWKAFVQQEKEAEIASKDLEEHLSFVGARLKYINNTASSLEIGSKISEEDYYKLQEYTGLDFSDNFAKVYNEDGTLTYEYVLEIEPKEGSYASVAEYLRSFVFNKEDIERENENRKRNLSELKYIDGIFDGTEKEENLTKSQKQVRLSANWDFIEDNNIWELKGLEKVSREQLSSLDEEQLDAYYHAFSSFVQDYQHGIIDMFEYEEMWVDASIENFADLKKAYQDGEISLKTYQKMRTKFFNQELEELGVTQEAYENYSKRIQQLHPELKNQSLAIEELALAYYSLNKGVNDVTSNYSSWQNLLENGSEEQKAQVYQEQKDTVGLILNLDLDTTLGEEKANAFIEDAKTQEIIAKIGAATDNESKKKAIDELEDYYIDKQVEIMLEAHADDEDFEDTKEQIDKLADYLKDVNQDLTFGDKLPEEFKKVVQEMVKTGKMGATEIANLLMAAGYKSALFAEAMTFNFEEKMAGVDDHARSGEARKWGVHFGLDTSDSSYIQTLKDPDALVEFIANRAIDTGNFTLLGVGTDLGAEDEDEDKGSKKSNSSYDKLSSSSKSESDKKDLTKLELERDIYHDINIELEKNNSLLEDAALLEDELVGGAYIQNLKTQNKELEKRNKLLSEKAEIQEEEQTDLQTKITTQSSGKITFDEDGTMVGYLDYTKEKQDGVSERLKGINELEEQYNTELEENIKLHAKTDTLQKKLDEKIETLEESGEEFDIEDTQEYKDYQAAAEKTKASDKVLEDLDEQIQQNTQDLNTFNDSYSETLDFIDRYDQLTFQEMPELKREQQENIDQMISNEIKALNYSVEVDLDLADAERSWIEFKWKVLDHGDSFSLFGEDIISEAQMLSEQLKTYPDTIKSLTDQVQTYYDIIADGGQFDAGVDMAQAIEQAEEYRDKLMETMEDFEEAIKEIRQLFLDMIDAANESFSDYIGEFELIDELLQHNITLVEKLSGEDSYKAMATYYDQMAENNNANLEFQKQQVEFWKERMDAEEYGTEAWVKYKENWEEAMQTLNNTVESSIDTLIAKYQNGVSEIVASLTNSLTGNSFGLDFLDEEWQLMNDNADAYLDKINSMFAIEQLEKKYTDAINDSDSLEVQERLNNVMQEQISVLEKKDKLTQYDVDRANMLYEIELKKIALEEAQQNKSKMRLRRDSQGNYSYQYVADENAIEDAKNDLETLQNSLYNLDKDAYRQNLNEVYDVYKEFEEKLIELYSDQTLSEEEREAKRLMYVQEYGERINGLITENEVIRGNLYESAFTELSNMYDTDLEAFTSLSQAEQDEIINGLVPQWDSGIQQMIDKFSAEGGFGPTVSSVITDLEAKNAEYKNDLEELAAAAGIELGKIQTGYEGVGDEIKDVQDKQGDLFSLWNNNLNTMEKIKDAADDYANSLQGVYDKVEQLIPKLNELIETQEKADGETTSSSNKNSNNNKSNTSSSSSAGKTTTGSNSTSTSSSKKNGSESSNSLPDYSLIDWRIAKSIHYKGDYATASSGEYDGKQVSNVRKARVEGMGGNYTNVQDIVNKWYVDRQDDVLNKWKTIELLACSKFDTGGYTGNWGNADGKIAMLHEKELVLNKTDTENILTAVNLVRTISGLMDSLEQSVMDRILGLNDIPVQQYNDSISQDQTIEQQVKIEASFPNATKSSEIEEAFNNLVNRATQYAFKTQR